MPVKWEKYLLILQTHSRECFKINLMEHTVGMQNIKKKKYILFNILLVSSHSLNTAYVPSKCSSW